MDRALDFYGVAPEPCWPTHSRRQPNGSDPTWGRTLLTALSRLGLTSQPAVRVHIIGAGYQEG